MAAAGKINFVAHIEAEPERAEVAFNAAARIKCRINVTRAKVLQFTRESGDAGRGIAEIEMGETSLDGDKQTYPAGGLKFGTDQAIQHPRIRAHETEGGGAVGVSIGECASEVVP